MHLDATFLKNDRLASNAKTIFNRLPYNDGKRDLNREVANISEHFLTSPFRNDNLYLKKGVHLHWLLPDIFKKGVMHKNADGKEQLVYPKVPNRWLVSRSSEKETELRKRWIVESDYLYPEGVNRFHQSVAFPIDLEQQNIIKPSAKNLKQPFRYIGRKVDFGSWKSQDSASEYLANLTAVGYGEPTFSAFYPNCYSMFGCYDSLTEDGITPSKDELNYDLSKLKYDAIGWYSDEDDNILNNADFQKALDRLDQNNFAEELEGLLRDVMGCRVDKPLESRNDIPSNIICYARLEFDKNYEKNSQNTKGGGITVSLANTGTEALFSVMSKKLSDDYLTQQTIEEQLRAIRVISKFDSYKSDKIDKFKEACYEKNFSAVSGGKIWYVYEDSNQANLADKDSNSASNLEGNITLHKSMSHLLNSLNIKQSTCDSIADKIIFQRQQLFSYWYKYMMCVYPPDDGRYEYPKPDEVKYYINNCVIPRIENLEKSQAEYLKEKNKAREDVEISLNSFNDSRVPYILQKIFNKEELVNDNIIIRPTSPVDDKTLADMPKFVEGSAFIKKYLDFSVKTNELAQDKGEEEHNIPSVVVGSFIKIEKVSFKSLSFWINISDNQVAIRANDKDIEYLNPTLLQVGKSNNSIISYRRTGNIWNKITVNGKELKKRYNTNFLWSDFPKNKWIHIYCEASESFSDQDLFIMSENKSHGFLNAKIASLRLFESALSDEEILCDKNIFGHLQYKLQSKEGPRYWQPNEPVVLMEGDIFKFSKCHGFEEKTMEKKLLECRIYDLEKELDFSKADDINYIQSQISNLHELYDKEKIGYNYCEKEPWHPLILEWEVELFPTKNKGNLLSDKREYSKDFITDNFKVDEHCLGLLPKDQALDCTKSAAIYRGATFITPGSKFMLAQDIKAYLIKLTKEHFENHFLGGDFESWFSDKPELDESNFCKNFVDFKSWYEAGFSSDKIKNDPIYTAIIAYEELEKTHAMSQSLGGFNSALIMRKQALQLPIADPLGFSSYRKFTKKVKKYISGESKYTPLPLNDFNPIISGNLRVLNLRILDSFGRHVNVLKDFSAKPLLNNNFVSSNSFKLSNNLLKNSKSKKISNSSFAYDLLLPTRFACPARLALRWFSADNADQEMNSHPATSPICGWLLTNNLDRSVMVYSQDGSLLGIIKQTGQWTSAPGNNEVIDVEHIPNKYLRNVVQKLLTNKKIPGNVENTRDDSDSVNLEEFIAVINKALEKIDPESFLHDQNLALLMGRPVAVVRAGVKFEVQGGIPINRSWTALRQELSTFIGNVKKAWVKKETKAQSMEEAARSHCIVKTDSLENVGVPIYIGDRDQFNDGVVGYWQEDKEGNLSKEFYTSLDTNDCKPTLKSNMIKPSRDDNAPNIIKSIFSDDMQNLTMLVDPRGKIHASCGILPKKIIEIPVDQYVKALSAINITFLSAPIISSVDQINLPIPNEAGYSWSWLQNINSNWYEKSSTGIVRKKQFVIEFKNGLDIWTELKFKGWIKEIDNMSAVVISADQRIGFLSRQFSQEVEKIEKILSTSYIGQVDIKSSLGSENAIYEGWLKLSPTKNN